MVGPRPPSVWPRIDWISDIPVSASPLPDKTEAPELLGAAGGFIYSYLTVTAPVHDHHRRPRPSSPHQVFEPITTHRPLAFTVRNMAGTRRDFLAVLIHPEWATSSRREQSYSRLPRTPETRMSNLSELPLVVRRLNVSGFRGNGSLRNARASPGG